MREVDCHKKNIYIFKMNLQYELFLAIQCENITLIENLIQQGADVNSYIDWKLFTKIDFLRDTVTRGKYLDFAISKVLQPFHSYLLGRKIFTRCTFNNVFSVIYLLVKYGATSGLKVKNYFIIYCLSVIHTNQTEYRYDIKQVASKRCLNCIALFKYLVTTGISTNLKNIDSNDPLFQYFFVFLEKFDNESLYNKPWYPNVLLDFCNLLLVHGYYLESTNNFHTRTENTKKLYNKLMGWPILQVLYCFERKNFSPFCFM